MMFPILGPIFQLLFFLSILFFIKWLIIKLGTSLDFKKSLSITALMFLGSLTVGGVLLSFYSSFIASVSNTWVQLFLFLIMFLVINVSIESLVFLHKYENFKKIKIILIVTLENLACFAFIFALIYYILSSKFN